MTTPTPDDLDRALTDATTWHGPHPDPAPWRAALAAHAADGAPPRRLRWSPAARRTALAAVITIGVIGTVVTSVLLDGASRDERIHMFQDLDNSVAKMRSPKRSGAEMLSDRNHSADGFVSDSLSSDAGAPGASRIAPSLPRQPAPPMATDRHIVRRATLDVRTPDVPGTFMKISTLLSAARGEYVETSSLTAWQDAPSADLTLRVRADRLDAVVVAIHDVATIVSESKSGDDVTSEVVDVEARLRNERRIEAEMLELLEARPDAPLDDVLTVRKELRAVRLTIEQLEGRRAALASLVDLATIVVTIRPERDDAETAPPTDRTLGGHFQSTISTAWTRGVRGLIDTGGTVLRIALAGAPWWIVTAIAVIALRRRLATTT